MSRDNTAPDRKARIVALSAMVLAVVGGLSLFTKASGETEPATAVTEPATVIATSCSGFEAAAHELFDKHDTAALRATFAPGEHVHLAIDLRGAGYSWQLTGVSGDGPDVHPSFWYALFRTTKWTTSTKITYTPASASKPASSSTESHGKIDGYARWDVEFDVATAGDGAFTINKTGSAPTSLRVAIASCTSGEGARYGGVMQAAADVPGRAGDARHR